MLTARQKMAIQKITTVVFFIPAFVFFMWFGAVIHFDEKVQGVFDLVSPRTRVDVGIATAVFWIILGLISFWRVSITLNDITFDGNR